MNLPKALPWAVTLSPFGPSGGNPLTLVLSHAAESVQQFIFPPGGRAPFECHGTHQRRIAKIGIRGRVVAEAKPARITLREPPRWPASWPFMPHGDAADRTPFGRT